MPTGPANVKSEAGFQVPPLLGQQTVKAAGGATAALGQPKVEIGSAGGAKQGKIPSPAQHNTEVLHQTRKIPYCPAKMAIGGFAVALSIAYFTLFSKKKPEATALDVARVTTGTATPQNTRPRS
ncbi:hypothetical protein M9H77_07200 [Catharanthus roseus]|uniref:Uncharacterized protein n=1 Tax=Catharanthus roseus TaxID=4058 RepID=A0ACC0BU88_CATRO|nr:hypothetical protein M9H77_07200 [Catharanthus roseus]